MNYCSILGIESEEWTVKTRKILVRTDKGKRKASRRVLQVGLFCKPAHNVDFTTLPSASLLISACAKKAWTVAGSKILQEELLSQLPTNSSLCSRLLLRRQGSHDEQDFEYSTFFSDFELLRVGWKISFSAREEELEFSLAAVDCHCFRVCLRGKRFYPWSRVEKYYE